MLSKETRKLKTHIMLTQIINGKILTPQGWLKDGSVLISDGKILEVTNCDLAVVGATLIDAKGMYIVPGGVEIHVHGGGGRDFMEGTEEAFHAAVGHTHETRYYQYLPHLILFYHPDDPCRRRDHRETDGRER